jgi:hypothetical protein
VGSLLSRVDNGGGVGVANLTDSQVNFINLGVRANVGMVLYNLTTGLSGEVTAVTANTLTATGVLWTDGQRYRIVTIDAQQIASIENFLDITAADVSSAVAAQAACDCTLQPWASDYLAKINIIETAMFYNCPCANPKITEEQQTAFIEWANTQLELIRTGEIALCEGDTGKSYPSFGYAEIAHTAWGEATIIDNYTRRTS